MKNHKSPYFVDYIKYFKYDNYHVLIMEYCEGIVYYIIGGSLEQLVEFKRQDFSKIDEKTIIKYLVEACKGIRFLHAMNLCHKNIKPQNFLLANHHRIKLSDTGLPELFPDRFSRIQNFPYYQSPEILNGVSYSQSADMWSWGCVLYELCHFEV